MGTSDPWCRLTSSEGRAEKPGDPPEVDEGPWVPGGQLTKASFMGEEGGMRGPGLHGERRRGEGKQEEANVWNCQMSKQRGPSPK